MEKLLLSNKYFQDILYQPIALQDTLKVLEKQNLDSIRFFGEKLKNNSLKRVILTGMGSSFHVLHPIFLFLLENGIHTLMFETSELVYYSPHLLSPDSLVITVSQSGRSAEIKKLLEINNKKSPIIGVTNTSASILAREADLTLITQAGDEFSVSCKTYTSILATLSFLGKALLGYQTNTTFSELRIVVEQMKTYLNNWENHLRYLVNDLNNIKQLMITGRGLSLSAAGTGGLIIKEAAQFHAEGMSSAAFRHGPFEMVSPELMVLVFAGIGPGNSLNKNLVYDIRRAGGRAELISMNDGDSPYNLSSVPEFHLPIMEILPIQMISLALALLKRHDPGTFERSSKVTIIE